MNKNTYKPPEFKSAAFQCPHCNTHSQQRWHNLYRHTEKFEEGDERLLIEIHRTIPAPCAAITLRDAYHIASICQHCHGISIWQYYHGRNTNRRMIYPLLPNAPLPNNDMPEEVKTIYNEARSISHLSPRAAAALLRVTLEKLTDHLGEKEGNLNTRIKKLKERGLPEKVIKSLDIVRIFGNESSHAGQIDLGNEDNADIVNRLFKLVNFVVEKMISDEMEIDALSAKLPDNKKQGVKNKDSES